MDVTTRTALELLYRTLLAAVVQLARALDKPCPVMTREEKRQARAVEGSYCETSDLMVK